MISVIKNPINIKELKYNIYSNFNFHLTIQTITFIQNLKFPNKSSAHENHPLKTVVLGPNSTAGVEPKSVGPNQLAFISHLIGDKGLLCEKLFNLIISSLSFFWVRCMFHELPQRKILQYLLICATG